jgi:hypothetical protein
MKLAKTLTIMAFATLLSMGAMGSAGHAYAQDAAASAQDDGGNAAAAVATPDMKTKTSALNFGGCWDGSNTDGSLQDQNYGSGYGWIGIVQKGAKIKGGNRGSYFEFVWDGGSDWAHGPLTGKATATGFTATGKAGGKCRVKIIGTFGNSNDIVGSYDFENCEKSNFVAVGTFDVPLNNSGCANILP